MKLLMIFKISEVHNVLSLNHKFILKILVDMVDIHLDGGPQKLQLITNINFCLCILVYRDILIGSMVCG